jgi:hypothetical protein
MRQNRDVLIVCALVLILWGILVGLGVPLMVLFIAGVVIGTLLLLSALVDVK